MVRVLVLERYLLIEQYVGQLLQNSLRHLRCFTVKIHLRINVYRGQLLSRWSNSPRSKWYRSGCQWIITAHPQICATITRHSFKICWDFMYHIRHRDRQELVTEALSDGRWQNICSCNSHYKKPISFCARTYISTLLKHLNYL